MAAATDEDSVIAKEVESLLRHSPASFSSLNDVVRKLEANLGVDLSHKAAFIWDHIALLHRIHPPPPPPPLPQRQPLPKDHFALRQYPQSQNYYPAQTQSSSHFAIQPQQHRHRPEEFSFQNLQQPPPQLQAPRPAQPGPVVGNAAAASKTPKERVKRKGGSGGLNKLCGVSRELEAVVGESALARTEIVKQLWLYIKKNNLQDPSNRRKILCDDALRSVFETDSTDMFKMNKLLAKHIIPLDPSKELHLAKRIKAEGEPALENDGVSTSVKISKALAKFFGSEEREMLQSEAVRRVWEYVKANSLEDPSNSMVIFCDAKLQELLGCESISSLGMSEMLGRHHLLKQS